MSVSSSSGSNLSVSPLRRVLRRGKHALWLSRRRADLLLARLPLLALKERVYDESFFAHTDAVHRPKYERLADAIVRHVRPRSVVDVGCGTGLLLGRLQAHGVEVLGIEGSRPAIRRSDVPGRIVRANLERGVPLVGRFDLCICIEVAEHLPRRAAPSLVRGLTRLSDRVLFTAAPPGQGGTLHVNEQPRAYWEALFAEHGFAAGDGAEPICAEIEAIEEPRWLETNLVVFERRS